MKSLLTILIFFFLSGYLIAQGKVEQEISFSVTPQYVGTSFLLGSCDGGSGMQGGWGYSMSIKYNVLLKDEITLNFGFEHFSSRNTIKEDMYSNIPRPDHVNFNMIRLPIGVGYSFARWFKIGGGIALDYQYNNHSGEYVSNQSGVSVYLDTGLLYHFNPNWAISFSSSVTHFMLSALTMINAKTGCCRLVWVLG